MSRSLKPLFIEHVFDRRTQARVDLMLDRNDKIFFAVVEHEKLEAPSIALLREAVRAAVAKASPVKWSRVIELNVAKSDDTRWGHGGHINRYQVELDVSFLRYEVGQTSAGLYLKRPFDEDLHETWREHVVDDPLRYSSTDYDGRPEKDGDGRRIPYSEAAWVALNGVKAAIEAAYDKLEPLFDAKDQGRKLLALTDMRLLPASTDVIDAAPTTKRARKR